MFLRSVRMQTAGILRKKTASGDLSASYGVHARKLLFESVAES